MKDWFGEERIDIAIGYVTAYGVRILVALLVLVVGLWGAGLVRNAIRRTMERNGVEPTLVAFVSKIAYYALLVAVVIAAISQVGIETTSFIAVLGAAGLAIGLALQGSLSNFASGVLLILFRPMRVGNFVEAGGVMGTVEEIGLLATQLRTPDNKGIVVPNSQVMGSHIVNFNAYPTRKLELVYRIGYREDFERAKAILTDIVESDPRTLKDPAPQVRVHTLGENSIEIVVRPWVRGEDYWPMYFDLQEGVKKRFDAEGITIPYPQRDVHLHRVPTRDEP